jgi:hypothetical protein
VERYEVFQLQAGQESDRSVHSFFPRAGEMKPADDGINPIIASDAGRMPDGVLDAGMTAAGDDDAMLPHHSFYSTR